MKTIDTKMRQATRIGAALSEELGRDQEFAQQQDALSRQQKKRVRIRRRLFRREREPRNKE